ncbi:MAG TPA: methyltransferase domain-containing protein [Humisphaera sp.]
MTSDDLDYVRAIVSAGLLRSDCLEMGAGYGGETCRAIVEGAGLRYATTDLTARVPVDVVADFEADPATLAGQFAGRAPFGSILCLNMLGNCFDPIRVLDNAVRLLAPGGTLVVVALSVWPLNDWPVDCWRMSPGFLVEYARRRGLELVPGTHQYVGRGPVERFRDASGQHHLPPPARTPARHLYARIVHRAFNTCARLMFFPSHVATGAVLRKPAGAT